MITPKKYTAILMFILFFLASCINTNTKAESPLPNTFTATPPLPVTATSTEAHSPTLSPTVFPTLPTLLPEDAHALLLRTLNENDACRLPCWLDITPGTSTHAEAYQKWAGFLIPSIDTVNPRKFYYDFEYSQNDFGYGINNFEFNLNDEDVSIGTAYYLQPNSETIDSMYITTQASKVAENGIPVVFESTSYKKILDSYLLSSILKKYGQPEQILLSMEIIEAEPTSPDYFRIRLFYPALGSIIEYWGNAEVENGVIYGCPSDTFVTLRLSAPNSHNLFSETLNQEIWSPSSPFFKSPEEALGITAEEFYKEFSKPIQVNRSCLTDSPAV